MVCRGEFESFLGRLELEPGKLLFIPILFNASDLVFKYDWLNLCLKYHFVTMSSDDYVDGFTALLGRIQTFLEAAADGE